MLWPSVVFGGERGKMEWVYQKMREDSMKLITLLSKFLFKRFFYGNGN